MSIVVICDEISNYYMKSKKHERKCCNNNKPIYEITYNLNKKWLVCNECFSLECFNSDIKERVRIQL